MIRFGNDSDEDTDDEESSQTESSSAINIPRGNVPLISRTPATPQSEPVKKKTLYIQMEFVEKQTLREAISQGMSEAECWRLFRQILDALDYLASIKIVHRDLKPSNILLGKSFVIVSVKSGLTAVSYRRWRGEYQDLRLWFEHYRNRPVGHARSDEHIGRRHGHDFR